MIPAAHAPHPTRPINTPYSSRPCAQSLRLGRRNLHMFRMTNNRFDIIGGMLYYLLVVRGEGGWRQGGAHTKACYVRMSLPRPCMYV